MVKKVRSFHELMRLTFQLQYLSFSFPTYTIENKTLILKKKSGWIEVIIAFAIVLPHIVFLKVYSKLTYELSVYNILLWMVNGTSILLSVITRWEAIVKAGLMKSIFQKIKNLDDTITLDSKYLNYLNVRVKIWCCAVVSIIGVLLATNLVTDKNAMYHTFNIVSIMRIYVTPVATLVQFLSLISIIQFYIEWIDDRLSSIKLSNFDGKGGCQLFTTYREIEGCTMANTIEKMRKLYGQIHDLKREVNEVFSLRLWMDTVNTILQIMFFVYSNLNMLKRGNEEFTMFLFCFHYIIFWIIFLILKFLQNVHICGKVTERSKNLGVTIHKIFSQTLCENVKNELITFSLELLHRDPYIKANRIFNIDYPLTASVLRGIIMQLIAIMQINLPDNKSNEFINLFGSKGVTINKTTSGSITDATSAVNQ